MLKNKIKKLEKQVKKIKEKEKEYIKMINKLCFTLQELTNTVMKQNE